MQITKTDFADLLIIEPKVFRDDRGYFFESYNTANFIEANFHHVFVQDNESKSDRGVIRGFHYQLAPFAQAKLVRVITGSVQDVVVDLRSDSETFGKAYSIILSGENKKQLFIPRGFAHGFAALEDDTIFSYKCDNLYNAEYERGLNVLDKTIFDSWEIEVTEMILSEKDTQAPHFKDAEKF